MTQNDTTTGSATPASAMVRPSEGRMLAGVAMALARRLELPVWLIRLGFVITAFMGGLGVVLYLAAWAMIRSETEPESLAERFFGQAGTTRSWVGIGLIALAVLIVLGEFTPFDDTFVWAAALLVIGLLLYSGAIPSSSKPGPSGPPSGPEPADTSAAAAAAVPSSPAAPAEPGAEATGIPAAADVSATQAPGVRRRKERSYLGRLTLGVALVAMGVLAAVDLSPLGFDPTARHYIALFTVIVGVGLLIGAFAGRARSLIFAGLILLPALMLSPWLDIGRPGTWTHTVQPTSFRELQTAYVLDVGAMDLDLTRLPWHGQSVVLRVRGDGAAVRIRVPSEVRVTGILSAKVGWLSTPTRAIGGLAPVTVAIHEPAERPIIGEVRIDAAVDVGTIHIETVDLVEDR